MTEPRRKRGPAPKISREAILDVARDLPDDGLTMTAISKKLGVTTPALYRYFPDRAAILDTLALEIRDRLEPPDPQLPWREWLMESIRRQVEFWRTHPDLQDDTTTRAVVIPALRGLEVGLDVLTRAGFEPAAALSAAFAASSLADTISHIERASAIPSQYPDLRVRRDEILAAYDLKLEADDDLPRVLDSMVTIAIEGIASLRATGSHHSSSD